MRIHTVTLPLNELPSGEVTFSLYDGEAQILVDLGYQGLDAAKKWAAHLDSEVTVMPLIAGYSGERHMMLAQTSTVVEGVSVKVVSLFTVSAAENPQEVA